MTVVAEFTIPPEAFPFGETLVEMPDMEIEIDQIVPSGESALPFFWVRGCEPDTFMEYAEGEPRVKDNRLLEKVDEVALSRAEWVLDAELINGLRELDVTIVESVGTADHWRFEVRTEDRDLFVAFQEVFEQQGIPISLNRLYDLEDLIEGDHRNLTADQRETLLTAYREGYFHRPQESTQADLAEQFDVSRRAISERLRRGTRNLVAATLLPDAGEQ